MSDSPRLIGRKEAAEYCGVSPTCFSMWVASHIMPPAVPGTRKWDRKAIDAKLDEISGLTVSDKMSEGGLSEWRRRRDERRQKTQDDDRPKHGLDKRTAETLAAMSYNTDLNTLELLPGAGPATMRVLVSKKLVTAEPEGTFVITEEGHAEAVRILAQMLKR